MVNLNTNINTITYSSDFNNYVKAGGRINKIKLHTSINGGGFNTIKGKINNNNFIMQNGGTIEINLNPNDNNSIDLELKGFCIVVVEKFIKKTHLKGKARLKPISFRIK